jgi:hypothetical protein
VDGPFWRCRCSSVSSDRASGLMNIHGALDTGNRRASASPSSLVCSGGSAKGTLRSRAREEVGGRVTPQYAAARRLASCCPQHISCSKSRLINHRSGGLKSRSGSGGRTLGGTLHSCLPWDDRSPRRG